MKSINYGVGWLIELVQAFLDSEQSWQGGYIDWRVRGQSTCVARKKA